MAADVKMIETLVGIITREVLTAMGEMPQGASDPAGAQCKLVCGENTCIRTCFDQVGKVISAGADRLSSGPGGVPADLKLAGMIDHTLLKPEATPDQITQLCLEARQYGFASVCINPVWVGLCAGLLKGSSVKVCTVIGFPLGANAPEVKVFEARNALDFGANELDMVLNIGAVKARDLKMAARDIRGVVATGHERGMLVKVIIETALLDDEEKVIACLLAKEAGADFVKTSTGFSTGGATVHDVALMRKVVGPEMGVKASGGVRTFEDANALVRAGATRIGASASVKIVQGPSQKKDQTATSTLVVPARAY
ncbi:MAG: deoxyribose-phosphate aldolase [Anaerolineaceae bacterium]|nr:deoxyribose-phosphate aldolase [Anaerolineaceae bacterium]